MKKIKINLWFSLAFLLLSNTVIADATQIQIGHSVEALNNINNQLEWDREIFLSQIDELELILNKLKSGNLVTSGLCLHKGLFSNQYLSTIADANLNIEVTLTLTSNRSEIKRLNLIKQKLKEVRSYFTLAKKLCPLGNNLEKEIQDQVSTAKRSIPVMLYILSDIKESYTSRAYRKEIFEDYARIRKEAQEVLDNSNKRIQSSSANNQ